MSHYSPLKKLFRRQKALRGVAATMPPKNCHEVVVISRPFFFVMTGAAYDQYRMTMDQLIETEWSDAALGVLSEEISHAEQ